MIDAKKKMDVDDKIISITIMSSAVVLTIQYLILITFQLIDTANGSIIQLVSKVVVGIIFLFTLPTVIKRNFFQFILIYFIAIFIFLLQYILFPENQKFLNELIFPIFFISLPVFLYSLSLHDWTILKNMMKKASVIVILFGIILGIQIFFKTASVGAYSMPLSYYLLLPSIMYLDDLMDKFNLKALIMFLISTAIILAIGARGPILCILVFVVLKLIKSNLTFKITKTRFYIYMVFLAILIVTLLNFEKLVLNMYNFFLKFGIDSRSLLIFLYDEVHLSGRDSIYQTILIEIANHPLLGIGIAGDRQVLGGNYAHNIFLEIWASFGVVIGSVLILTFLLSMIKLLFMKDMTIYNMMITWISLGFVSLFVSGTYLTEINFWILLGLTMSKLSVTRKNKVNLDGG